MEATLGGRQHMGLTVYHLAEGVVDQLHPRAYQAGIDILVISYIVQVIALPNVG